MSALHPRLDADVGESLIDERCFPCKRHAASREKQKVALGRKAGCPSCQKPRSVLQTDVRMDRVLETALTHGAPGARRPARSYFYYWRFT